MAQLLSPSKKLLGFERVLGNALSGAYTRKGTRVGGTIGGSSICQAPGGSGSNITGGPSLMCQWWRRHRRALN